MFVMFKLPSLVFLSALLLFAGVATGDSYETHVRPFLTRYCVGCHGPDEQKAKLRLDMLDPDMIRGSDTDMWQEVLDLLNVSEMPPKKATGYFPPPSAEELNAGPRAYSLIQKGHDGTP